MQTLAHASFAAHAELADALDGVSAYGFRRMSIITVEPPPGYVGGGPAAGSGLHSTGISKGTLSR